MGMDVPVEADPEAGITLTYAEFLEAHARLVAVDFPMTRKPEDAWPDFVGWRVNYESTAYQIAAAIDAVPALWSGPRRHPSQPISPDRPPAGRQRMRQPPSEASSAAPTPGTPDQIYDPS
jgi:hypothetical protein